MNIKIISVICASIFFSVIPNSFANSQNSTLDEQGNYLSPSLGIGFQAPEGWIVQEPKKTQPGAPDVAIVGPYSGEFTPSITFIVEKANDTSLENYFEEKKNQIISQSHNVSFLSEQDNTIDGFSAKVAVIKEDFESQGQSTKIKFEQAIVFANNNFYTITYANEEKNFDSSLSSYVSLLNSTKFTNSQNFSGIGLWLPIGGIAAAITIGLILVFRRKR